MPSPKPTRRQMLGAILSALIAPSLPESDPRAQDVYYSRFSSSSWAGAPLVSTWTHNAEGMLTRVQHHVASS
jgi:hypothetical protein